MDSSELFSSSPVRPASRHGSAARPPRTPIERSSSPFSPDSSPPASATAATPTPAAASHPGGSTFDAEDARDAREAALQRELDGVRQINTVLEGVIGTLERTHGDMKTVVQTVGNASALLNTWTRLLSQTEHNQRLLLDPTWRGASQDLAEAEAEAEQRRQQQMMAERRAAEHQRRQEEAKRKTEEAEERKRLAGGSGGGGASSSGPGLGRSVRGSVRGRAGRGRYGISSSSSASRVGASATATSASSSSSSSRPGGFLVSRAGSTARYGRVGTSIPSRSADTSTASSSYQTARSGSNIGRGLSSRGSRAGSRGGGGVR